MKHIKQDMSQDKYGEPAVEFARIVFENCEGWAEYDHDNDSLYISAWREGVYVEGMSDLRKLRDLLNLLDIEEYEG